MFRIKVQLISILILLLVGCKEKSNHSIEHSIKHDTVWENKTYSYPVIIEPKSDTGNYYVEYLLLEGKGKEKITKKTDSSFYEIKYISQNQNEIIHYINGKVESRYQEIIKGNSAYYYAIPDMEKGEYLIGYLYYIKHGDNSIDRILISPNSGTPIKYQKDTYRNGLITYTSGRLNLHATQGFEKRGSEIFEFLLKNSLNNYMSVTSVKREKLEDSLVIQSIYTLY